LFFATRVFLPPQKSTYSNSTRNRGPSENYVILVKHGKFHFISFNISSFLISSPVLSKIQKAVKEAEEELNKQKETLKTYNKVNARCNELILFERCHYDDSGC
jgi:hypothetical protein